RRMITCRWMWSCRGGRAGTSALSWSEERTCIRRDPARRRSAMKTPSTLIMTPPTGCIT
ncbi:hypothetical protein M9458_042670, partial [Cirrhinus mrigala]